MPKQLYFYFHAGSANHGCEAIVRSTSALFSNHQRPILLTDSAHADKNYGLEDLVDIIQPANSRYSILDKVRCKIADLYNYNECVGYDIRGKHESANIRSGSVAFSIGGDTYCYGNAYNYHLAAWNKHLHRKNCKTILWGCSIEPEKITESMKIDFARYDYIVARESISYTTLKSINSNTLLACDPAFNLNKANIQLPHPCKEKETVGINISPMIQSNEKKKGITLRNYDRMISYIIDNTSYNIALIPHVVLPSNDDRIPLQLLFDKYKESGRIVMIDDCTCEQLKGYISQCSLFIGARTHATIAAYSTYVPTLVIGYSTKAIGIARDIFGTDRNYVLPVQELQNDDDMQNGFIWLDKHKHQISERLKDFIPSYSQSIKNVAIQIYNELC